jgi:hypothetical protein
MGLPTVHHADFQVLTGGRDRDRQPTCKHRVNPSHQLSCAFRGRVALIQIKLLWQTEHHAGTAARMRGGPAQWLRCAVRRAASAGSGRNSFDCRTIRRRRARNAQVAGFEVQAANGYLTAIAPSRPSTVVTPTWSHSGGRSASEQDAKMWSASWCDRRASAAPRIVLEGGPVPGHHNVVVNLNDCAPICAEPL